MFSTKKYNVMASVVIGANIYAFNKHRIACNNLCNVLDKKYEAIEKYKKKEKKIAEYMKRVVHTKQVNQKFS